MQMAKLKALKWSILNCKINNSVTAAVKLATN